MKLGFVLFCLLLITRIGYSQPTESKIIGKWIITNVTNNAIITICGSKESNSEIEVTLNQNYIGASIEFLETKKLRYRDKKNRLESEKNSIPFIRLYDFTWAFTTKNKIEIIEISSNTSPKRIRITCQKGKIYFDFIGIVFELEKKIT